MRIRPRVIFVIGLLIVGVLLFTRGQSQNDAEDTTPDRTTTVELGTLEVRVTGTGEIAPTLRAELSFDVSGTVDAAHAQVGDQVNSGDVLLALNTVELELAVAQAQQTLLIQQANYSMTVQPDPAAVVAAQAAIDSANAAHIAAKDKYALRDDQVTVGCANLENAKDTLEQAQQAYDNVLNFWKTRDFAPVSPQKTQLDNAQNNYNVALANCNLTRSDIDNDSAVRSTLAQLEEAKANLTNLTQPRSEQVLVAQAQVEQARLSLEQARFQLSKAFIIAPFNGTVLAVDYQVGDSATPGQTAIVLADIEHLHIDTTVDELDIALVSVGQPVEIELDALPGVSLSGEVAEIEPAPVSESAGTEYPVRVELASSIDSVRIGMTTALNILVARKENVLLIPNWALRLDPDTREIVVTVQKAESAIQTGVTLGLRNDTYSEILSGLEPGDVVGILVTPEPSAQQGFFGGGN